MCLFTGSVESIDHEPPPKRIKLSTLQTFHQKNTPQLVRGSTSDGNSTETSDSASGRDSPQSGNQCGIPVIDSERLTNVHVVAQVANLQNTNSSSSFSEPTRSKTPCTPDVCPLKEEHVHESKSQNSIYCMHIVLGSDTGRQMFQQGSKQTGYGLWILLLQTSKNSTTVQCQIQR